jgi:hypothetical protein
MPDHRGLADAMRSVLENRACGYERKGEQEFGRHYGYYREEEREFDAKMEDYFRRLHEGKTSVPNSLCEVMATGMQMYWENSGHGASADDEHHRYKAAIERLREEKDMNAKERLMKELFDDLSPDEMVVLREKAKAKSYRELAREKWGSNATADRWMDAVKGLKHKLKHSA